MAACHIQIGDDPTVWWLTEPIQPSQLTQPLTVQLYYPIWGILVLSPRASHVAIYSPPPVLVPEPVSTAALYLPTAAGVTAGDVGYDVPNDPVTLSQQIQALMHSGQTLTLTLGGTGGTLVLNGATLPFAVTSPNPTGGPTPHG
jgi:hypothetical protein